VLAEFLPEPIKAMQEQNGTTVPVKVMAMVGKVRGYAFEELRESLWDRPETIPQSSEVVARNFGRKGRLGP
jgi:hypothetical protein